MELKNPTCHHRWGSSLGSNAFPVWWAQNFSASISVTFISTLASVIHKQTNPWPSFSAFTPWEGAGEGLCCEITLVNWCPLFSMLLQAPSSRPSFTELFSGSCRPAPHLTTVLMQIKSNHPTTFSTDITALWLSSFQLRGGALAYFFLFLFVCFYRCHLLIPFIIVFLGSERVPSLGCSFINETTFSCICIDQNVQAPIPYGTSFSCYMPSFFSLSFGFRTQRESIYVASISSTTFNLVLTSTCPWNFVLEGHQWQQAWSLLLCFSPCRLHFQPLNSIQCSW